MSPTYTALSIRLRGLGCPWPSYIYFKEHKDESGQLPEEAGALFATGLPRALDERRLVSLFSTFGTVQQVQLHPSKTSAIVVFAEHAAVKAARKAGKEGVLLELPAQQEQETPKAIRGLRAQVQAHKAQYRDPQELKQELTSWLEEWKQAEEDKEKQRLQAAMDDGWTVVTSKAGKRKHGSGAVAGGIDPAVAHARAAAKKPKVVNDLYKFHEREKKKQQVLDLRQQFEDAKKQVRAMRANRVFKAV